MRPEAAFLLLILSGLTGLVRCQEKRPPFFLNFERNGVDGDLKNRLEERGIREDTQPGTVIGLLRCADDKDNSSITYQISSQTLRLNPSVTGQVILRREVDREANKDDVNNPVAVPAVFRCTDNEGESTQISVRITVNDVNDNAPAFQFLPYNTIVPEDTPVDTEIFSEVYIVDRDESGNAQVDVSCYSNPTEPETMRACEYFRVESVSTDSGRYRSRIFLKRRLDYEGIKSHTLALLAKDQGTPSLNSTVNILVRVNDTQDSDPIFLYTPYALYINENEPVNATVSLRLSATDGDVGIPRAMRIKMKNDPLDLFELSETNQDPFTKRYYYASISVKRPIDREALASPNYMFEVEAIELENGQETNSRVFTNVSVNVRDINDNKPEFEQNQYEIFIPESDQQQSNTQVANLNIRVRDRDDATNAKFRVEIASQDYDTFELVNNNVITGSISVQMTIKNNKFTDYDVAAYRRQTVVLRAYDIATNESSTTTLIVLLGDINDNYPHFTRGTYIYSIPENAQLGTYVATISATDKDSDTAGNVLYSLTGAGSESFRIDQSSGNVTLALLLDYETQRKFDIIVVAKDQGDPVRENTTILTINVNNINDLPPVPDHKEYLTYALETSRRLRPEVVIQARDTESPDTADITYRIVHGNSPNQAFFIGERSGRLELVQNVDYDDTPNKQGFFEVVVEISDNGSPAQTVNVTVRVDVQDENNNTPRFLQSVFFANVSENDQPGNFVIKVTATDADSRQNGEIRYTIQSGGRDDFDISEGNGFISVSNKSRLDFNSNPSYNLVVYAIDRGSPPKTGSAEVRITVLDANNKAPRFAQDIYVTSIREDVNIGTRVNINITASDVDSTARIQYSLQRSSFQARDSKGTLVTPPDPYQPENAFVVDPNTGRLSTAAELKRDEAAEIAFKVLATDVNAERGVQTATTSVMITILGSALSNVQFIFDSNYFTVLEGKPIGYVITTVLAKDPSCPSCKITYAEVPQSDAFDFLAVDPDSGDVSLTQPLDYEDRLHRRLSMEIVASVPDGRSARVKVSVDVTDDNDNSPYFDRREYFFQINEGQRYPSGLGYVQARDADSGSFADIVYSLSGQGSQDFIISDEGYIRIARGVILDYEKTKRYNLLVTAVDNPSNETSTVRRQNSTSVRIDLNDINDNKPVFTDLFPFYIVENTGPGVTVGYVRANDADSGRNGQILYYFTSRSQYFRITENGMIITNQSLRDTADLSPFFIRVRAEDRGFPSEFAERDVEIIVRSGQLDDGKPRWIFPRLGVRYTVEESTTREQLVLQASALARSDSQKVFYSMNTDSKDHTKFSIDRLTGNVTTTAFFDREEKAVYELILVATDQENATLQSYRSLIIDVLDKNDSIPDFTKCPGVSPRVPQTTTIPEDTAVNTSVYQVKACDLDQYVNGVLYEEERSNPMCVQDMAGGYFRVTTTGEIYTAKPLDREKKGYYLVCVRAWQAPARRKRQVDGFDRSQMTNPAQIAYVVITLSDVNDQGPMFPNNTLGRQPRVYTAVVPSIPTESTVLRVEAVDNDLPPYNRVRYSIKDIIFREPGAADANVKRAFLIGGDTGIITAAYRSYGDFRIPGSYFEMQVEAEDFYDYTLRDRITLKVYIFEPTQTLRVVIDQPPDVARGEVDNMIKKLSVAMPNSIFNLQQISYHRVIDEYDVRRTDVCFLIITDDKVQSVSEGSNAINDSPDLSEVLKEYGSRSPGSCYKSRSSLDKINWSPLWWTLVAIAIFIFICCCILIAAICILFKNYKNYMKTRRTYIVPQ